MGNVEKFIEIREHIEMLAAQIAASTKRSIMPEPGKLDEARGLLTTLTAMVDNDVQENVIERLTKQLGTLGIKVEALAAKKARKKATTARAGR